MQGQQHDMDAAADAAAPVDLVARDTGHDANFVEHWPRCAHRVLVIVLPACLPVAADGHSEIEAVLVRS